MLLPTTQSGLRRDQFARLESIEENGERDEDEGGEDRSCVERISVSGLLDIMLRAQVFCIRSAHGFIYRKQGN